MAELLQGLNKDVRTEMASQDDKASLDSLIDLGLNIRKGLVPADSSTATYSLANAVGKHAPDSLKLN